LPGAELPDSLGSTEDRIEMLIGQPTLTLKGKDAIFTHLTTISTSAI
jgi:hypothetical protein